MEDARRQEKERTAAEEAEKAPPPDPRDAERRELWKELGAYGDSLRERVDFPENYDEVVQLMSRNDLTQKEETWSEAALAGGDFSKYANLFADDENDKKLRAGLATIERLDRRAREGPREGSSCQGHGATAASPCPKTVVGGFHLDQ